jgi:hypothetical protein
MKLFEKKEAVCLLYDARENYVTLSFIRAVVAAALVFGAVDLVRADDELTTYAITLKDHHFTPAEIHVPSGKPFIVVVTNADSAAEEFEMLLPPLERVVRPGEQGKVKMRPLAPGRFPFFGENDPDSERGAFISE